MIDEDGWTPLIWAARFGHTDAVRLFLNREADCNTATNNGRTALILAAYNGHSDALQLLIDNGADCNAWAADFCSSS